MRVSWWPWTWKYTPSYWLFKLLSWGVKNPDGSLVTWEQFNEARWRSGGA